MAISNYILALIPISFPAWYLIALIDNPLLGVGRWSQAFRESNGDSPAVPPVGSQLLAYVVVALLGYVTTDKLVPNIKVRAGGSGFKR
jgi:hypothetical protein